MKCLGKDREGLLARLGILDCRRQRRVFKARYLITDCWDGLLTSLSLNFIRKMRSMILPQSNREPVSGSKYIAGTPLTFTASPHHDSRIFLYWVTSSSRRDQSNCLKYLLLLQGLYIHPNNFLTANLQRFPQRCSQCDASFLSGEILNWQAEVTDLHCRPPCSSISRLQAWSNFLLSICKRKASLDLKLNISKVKVNLTTSD